jgi:hypothetical protein
VLLPGRKIDLTGRRHCGLAVNQKLLFTLIFVSTLIGSAWLHEACHSVAALIQGVPSVPTPFKEYPLQQSIGWPREIWISFGGVAGTVLLVVGTILWYLFRNRTNGEAVLAGVLVAPATYTVRFAIAGRGHDDAEWQAAQTVLGVNPGGHFLDIVFLLLCITAVAGWMIRRRDSLRMSSICKVAALMVCGVVILVSLQSLNNLLFDRFFPRTSPAATGETPSD